MSVDQAYASIEPTLNRRTAIVFVEVLAQLGIALFFIAAIVEKITVQWDWWGFIEQFTNWSWTLQTLTYLLTLGVPFIEQGLVRYDSPLGSYTEVVTLLLFFATLDLTFVVVVAISIIFATDPTFLNDLLLGLPATLIVLGNDVYHVWTVVFILIFYIAHWPYIWFILNRRLNPNGVIGSAWRHAFVIFYLVFVAPGLALLIYCFNFDPHVTYRTKISDGVGIAIVLATLLVTSFVGTMLVLYGEGVALVVLDPWWLLHVRMLEPRVAQTLKQR